MFIPFDPKFAHSGVNGAYPVLFAGTGAPDGDGYPWLQAPIGSIYQQLDRTNNLVTRTFTKLKASGVDTDWVAGLQCITETVAYTAFTDGGSTSGTYNLKTTLPEGAWVLRTVIEDLTGFTGDTSAVIIVGDGTDTDRYNTGTPSVFTTATAADLGAPSGTQIHTAAKTVTITITSGSDWGLVTAGSLTIRLYYLI